MKRAPVYFIGHGSPMNAIADNAFTQALARMRAIYPKPKAILCVSAHWMTEGSWVTHMRRPRTIHDFHGFPDELFAVNYPASGSPEVAEMVRATVTSTNVHLDNENWGLDHGTWSVLRHIFANAEVPVIQLSFDMSQPPQHHFKIASELRRLREEGVLIIGSGNVVHNLRRILWQPDAPAFDWATQFDEWVKDRLLARDFESLVQDYRSTLAGELSVPTPDHYIPFIYALGAADEHDRVRFEHEEMQNGSISMRTVTFGAE